MPLGAVQDGGEGVTDMISRAAAIDAIVSVTVFPDADYIKNLCENPSNSEDWLGGVCEAINAVEEVNAVDAVPVVHGRWVHHRGGFNDHFECTACGEAIVLTCKWRFCPNCGAKMDGERRDDDGKGA